MLTRNKVPGTWTSTEEASSHAKIAEGKESHKKAEELQSLRGSQGGPKIAVFLGRGAREVKTPNANRLKKMIKMIIQENPSSLSTKVFRAMDFRIEKSGPSVSRVMGHTLIFCVFLGLAPSFAYSICAEVFTKIGEAKSSSTPAELRLPTLRSLEDKVRYLMAIREIAPNIFADAGAYGNNLFELLEKQNKLLESLSTMPGYADAIAFRENALEIQFGIAEGKTPTVEVRQLGESTLQSWRVDLKQALSDFESSKDGPKESDQFERSQYQEFYQSLVEKRQRLPLRVEATLGGLMSVLTREQKQQVRGDTFEERLVSLKRVVDSKEALPTQFDSARAGFSGDSKPQTFGEVFNQLESAHSLDQQLNIQSQLLFMLQDANFDSFEQIRKHIQSLDIESMSVSMDKNEVQKKLLNQLIPSLPEPALNRLLDLANKRFQWHISKSPMETQNLKGSRLVQQPAAVGVFRSCVTRDCSSDYDFGVPYAPAERSFFIYRDENSESPLGAVTSRLVESDGQKYLYVSSIAGRGLASADVTSILEGLHMAREELGVAGILLAEPASVSQLINQPHLAAVFKKHSATASEAKQITYSDEQFRTEVEKFGVTYDEMRANKVGRLFRPMVGLNDHLRFEASRFSIAAPQLVPLTQTALLELALELHFGKFKTSSQDVLSLSKFSQEEFDRLIESFSNQDRLAEEAYLSRIAVKMRELLGDSYDVKKFLKTSPHLLQEGATKSLILQKEELPSQETLSVALSSDGATIVTRGSGGVAKIFNSITEKEQVIKHGNHLYSAYPSSDGTKILTASNDNTARVSDLLTGKEITIPHDGPVFSAIFSPNEKKVLTTSSRGIAKVIDIESGKQMIIQHDGSVSSALFSVDGTKVVTASGDGTAKVFDLVSGEMKKITHRGSVNAASFSLDGTKVITASDDKTSKILDLLTGLETTIQHRDRVLSALFSPDGTKVVTASRDGTAKVFDLVSGEVKEITHRRRVNSASFSPDGNKVVTASEDGAVKIFDLLAERERIMQHDVPFISALFSPDGTKVVAVSEDRIVKVWDLLSEDVKKFRLASDIIFFEFSPDSRLLVIGDKASGFTFYGLEHLTTDFFEKRFREYNDDRVEGDEGFRQAQLRHVELKLIFEKAKVSDLINRERAEDLMNRLIKRENDRGLIQKVINEVWPLTNPAPPQAER